MALFFAGTSTSNKCINNEQNFDDVIPPATAADLMLGACAAALKDNKHSKLRQTAVQSLQDLMVASTSSLRQSISSSSPSSSSSNGDQQSMFTMTLNVERRRVFIEELLSIARNDDNPDVKTAAAAAFAEWKRSTLMHSMSCKS